MADIVKRLRTRAKEDYEMLNDIHIPLLEAAAEIERLRSALIPFACRCARKGEGAGGTCLAPGGICSWWNARAALEEKQ